MLPRRISLRPRLLPRLGPAPLPRAPPAAALSSRCQDRREDAERRVRRRTANRSRSHRSSDRRSRSNRSRPPTRVIRKDGATTRISRVGTSRAACAPLHHQRRAAPSCPAQQGLRRVDHGRALLVERVSSCRCGGPQRPRLGSHTEPETDAAPTTSPWVGTTPQERRRARKQPYACAHDETELNGERYLTSSTPALDWSEAYPLGDGSLGSLIGGERVRRSNTSRAEGLVQTRKFVEGRHAADHRPGRQIAGAAQAAKKETAEDRLWAARPATPLLAFGEAAEPCLMAIV